MPRTTRLDTISDEDVQRRVANFRVDERWLSGCFWARESKTPGLFYHGSPDVDIPAFRTRVDIGKGIQTSGAFFTQNPTYAAAMLGRFGTGRGGRIYEFELVSTNPLVVDTEYWTSIITDREAEAQYCQEAHEAGFDVLVTLHNEGSITEAIALADGVIQRRGYTESGLQPWIPDADGTLGRMLFYRAEVEAEQSLDDRSVYVTCSPMTDGAPRVLVNPVNPVYCEQDTWGKFDLEFLRFLSIDIVVDPASGNALVTEPATIYTVNRRLLRA